MALDSSSEGFELHLFFRRRYHLVKHDIFYDDFKKNSNSNAVLVEQRSDSVFSVSAIRSTAQIQLTLRH